MEISGINSLALPIITFLLFLFFSFVAVFILNKIIKFATKKLSLNIRIAKALRTPLRLFIIIIGVLIAHYYIKPGFKIDGFNLLIFYKIAGLFIVAIALANITKEIFVWYVEKIKREKKAVIDDTIFHFLTKVITVLLYLVAILITLSLLGIEIKPVLAGLGIAGLAVALALQDTLSNFFSAIYIVADQPVKIGDFIEISTGERGYVSEIGWRSTRIRTRENNMVIIPNSKLSQSVVTNYNQVHNKFRIEIPVGVHYNSDLKKTERITIDVAKKVMKKLEPEIKDFEPYIRYEQFGDSSINFKASLMTENVENRSVLIHEFVKALHDAFRKNKVEIPYPQRDVHLKR